MKKGETRTEEQLRNHYLVEKQLAEQLLSSSRSERSALYSRLYEELFSKVPDHPRLQRRDTVKARRRSVAARMRLLQGQFHPGLTFLEFAPGDCALAYEVCRHVGEVIAVDISDQRGDKQESPENFSLVVYDGYNLEIPDGSVDLLFSYQFLEHLHPEDVDLHFESAYRLLRPGGAYIFDTPHRYSGPHDISRHFSDVPEGLHLKEWTYREMLTLLKKSGLAVFILSGEEKPVKALSSMH